ncbi:hypothetical protein [[Mycoplasma] testudinis]|uniref:hypothetical protein n=1 Tax=[Mycoplasma] testudinis TaxID=33924 RepID=UPI000A6F90E4|nr:hypothetical protein [[Mycoplasma] testudinis]
MKKETLIKSWNLPKEYDEKDLAYSFGKMAVKLLEPYEPKKLDYQESKIINFFNPRANELINNEQLYKGLINQLTGLTKLYLTLSENQIKLAELKRHRDWIYLKDFCFEIIYEALMLARTKVKYVIEVQFDLLEVFLYVVWFFASQKTTIKIFENVVPLSFAYPGISFESQYNMSCRSAKINYSNQEATTQTINILKGIANHFMFHELLAKNWEENFVKENNHELTKKCEIRIFEWIILHYLLPLYISVHGYKENDKNFKNLIHDLFYYDFKEAIIAKGCNLLLQANYKVQELKDKELIEIFEMAKPRIKKFKENFLIWQQKIKKPNELNGIRIN